MVAFDAQKFVGKWAPVQSDNFDEYLKAAGVGFAARLAAKTIKPMLEIQVNGDRWKMSSSSTFKNFAMEWDIGREVQHETIDGRKMKSTFTIEGNKLVQKETHVDPKDKDSRIDRYVDDDKLVIDMECQGVKAKRVYKRA